MRHNGNLSTKVRGLHGGVLRRPGCGRTRMTPGEVLLEPGGEHQPVRVGQPGAIPRACHLLAGANRRRGGEGGAGRPGLTRRQLTRRQLTRPGLTRPVGHFVEVGQAQPERVRAEQPLQPHLRVPELHRYPHTRRQVHPEPPVTGQVQQRRGTVVAQPPRPVLEGKAARRPGEAAVPGSQPDGAVLSPAERERLTWPHPPGARFTHHDQQHWPIP